MIYSKLALLSDLFRDEDLVYNRPLKTDFNIVNGACDFTSAMITLCVLTMVDTKYMQG